MTDLKNFKTDFKKHLETTINSSDESDIFKRLSETERSIDPYFKKYFINDDGALESFKKEARAIAKKEYENLVKKYIKNI